MDLRVYYKKVREVESKIAEPYVVLVSLGTADGGKEGVRTQVSRESAAKHVVEGRARLATPEETAAYEEETQEAKRVAEQAAAVNRVQFVVVPSTESRHGKQLARLNKDQ